MAITTRIAALAFAGFALAITATAQSLSPAEEGRRLYLSNNCYGCHGDVGGGSAYGAPAFRREGAELGDLTEAIQEGEDRGMPAFPNLNNTTAINNLYAYLSSLGSSSEPTFYDWWEAVPTALFQAPGPRLYILASRETRPRRPDHVQMK
jgi:mono/diheme cytochrome c family protein